MPAIYITRPATGLTYSNRGKPKKFMGLIKKASAVREKEISK
jgi:hypothetical protein